MDKDIKSLALYRLERAEQAINDARVLIDNSSYQSSANRSYYAMFYSVLSLLVVKGMETSKHSGVLALFDREFVKPGIFDKRFSKMFRQAFDLRQQADYEDLFRISKEDSEFVLENAKEFVKEIKEYFNRII